MATCDSPSDLVYRLGIQRLASDQRIAVSPPEPAEDRRLRSQLQGNDADKIFYFIEPRPRNPFARLGSFVFLAVVVLASIIVPLLHVDPLPKRETVTMLYLAPPPAAGGSATKFQAPRPVSTYRPSNTALIAPVHKTEEEVPQQVGTVGGVVGGVPGGVIGGIPGGMLTEMATGTRNAPLPTKSADPAPVKRMRIASRVAEANLIHDVPPQYPQEAGRARIEGTVVLMALIGKDGAVKDVQVESGLPILAQAAIDAVKQWRYKPYLIDGEPVEVDSRITINFTLSPS